MDLKAQKFIFMEYHAIEDAEAWHKIQDVLEERVKAGVEVRVFYDDMGSIGFIRLEGDAVQSLTVTFFNYTHPEMCMRHSKLGLFNLMQTALWIMSK